jgi:hypothetical protein
MGAMRFLKRLFRTSSALGVLACLVVSGYTAQSILIQQHSVQHYGEKHFRASSQQPVISAADCLMCDLAQIVPQATQVVVAVQLVQIVGIAPALPPIFSSENAILLPFGARAPPFSLS